MPWSTRPLGALSVDRERLHALTFARKSPPLASLVSSSATCMNGRDLRTRYAVQALDFAETFNAGLGALSLKPGAYQPQLTAPEGPSTGGGVQAVQHVRLVPARQGYPSILVGSANQRLGTVELRSFEYIDAVHRRALATPRAPRSARLRRLPRGREELLREQPARRVDRPRRPRASRAAAPAEAAAAAALRRAASRRSSPASSRASLIGGLTIWILLRRAPAPAAIPPAPPASNATAPRPRPESSRAVASRRVLQRRTGEGPVVLARRQGLARAATRASTRRDPVKKKAQSADDVSSHCVDASTMAGARVTNLRRSRCVEIPTGTTSSFSQMPSNTAKLCFLLELARVSLIRLCALPESRESTFPKQPTR